MIKITKLESKSDSNVNLILIPGGPGLSSNTIRNLDPLSYGFNLNYIDFPGTNLNPYNGKMSFDDLSNILSDSISNLDGPKIAIGHSFGGLFACSLALKGNVDSVVCMGVPMSAETLKLVGVNYSNANLPNLKISADQWTKYPTDENFTKWLSDYEHLYFSSEKLDEGKELLRNDFASAQFFLDNRSDISSHLFLFNKMRSWSGKKLFIAGEHDGLLPVDSLAEDARSFGFNFQVIKKSSHFMMFDQPIDVCQTIINFLNKE